ncbi:hypothetical protein OUZ56_028776 [Daphnia magna]|uniref:Uncharacterized protein n=1 Tax=Daphnia magna TaxID=35525 RepID=A0ABR0B4W5_9CRUS|nr:hypothetical protein OUZ56_028776 [Daphnia magna]
MKKEIYTDVNNPFDLFLADGYDGGNPIKKITAPGNSRNNNGYQFALHKKVKRKGDIDQIGDYKKKGHGYSDGYSEYNYDHGKGKKEKESEGNLKNKNVQPDALRLHLTVLKNLSQDKKNPPHLGYENNDMQGKPYGIVTIKDTKENGGTNRRYRRSGGNGFDTGEIGGNYFKSITYQRTRPNVHSLVIQGYIILSHEIKNNDKGGRGIGGHHYNGGIEGGYDSDGRGAVYKNDGRGSNFAGGDNVGGKRSTEPTADGKINGTPNNGNRLQNSIKNAPPIVKHNGNGIRNVGPAISVSNAIDLGKFQTGSRPVNGIGNTGPIGGAGTIPTNNAASPLSNKGLKTNIGNVSNQKTNPVQPISPKPIPNISPKPIPNISSKPVPNISPKPVPTISPKPVPTISPKPVPTISPKPVPTISAKHVANISPKLVPTTSPKPVPTTSPKPVPTTSPKPVPTTSPKPVPTTSPKPVPTTSPKPVPTTSPKPVPTTSPKPVPTTNPKPVPTTSPKPVPQTRTNHQPQTCTNRQPQTRTNLQRQTRTNC